MRRRILLALAPAVQLDEASRRAPRSPTVVPAQSRRRGTYARRGLQVRAGRAFLRQRCRLLPGFALAPLVPAVVERLVVDVGDEAEPERAVGVIEDQAVRLALGRAQPSSDDLDVEHLRAGRPGKDDAADVPVDTGRQAVDVADDLDLALAEPSSDALALVGRRVGIDIAGGHAGGLELVGELAGMSPVDGEAERRTIFSKAQPGR